MNVRWSFVSWSTHLESCTDGPGVSPTFFFQILKAERRCIPNVQDNYQSNKRAGLQRANKRAGVNELCNQAQCIRVEPRSKFRLNIFSGSPVTDASYEILSPFDTPQKMN